MKKTLATLIALLVFCIQSLPARSKTRASTTQPAASLATETFAGSYRTIPKTTIARNGPTIAPVKEYKDLHSLLITLPGDQEMRTKYPTLKKGLKKGWAANRVPDEIRNIRIRSCWIVSAKHEGAKGGDHDFHVILSNSPTTFSEVMNAESVCPTKDAHRPRPSVG